MRYDRQRVMRTAHAEWRATCHMAGASFSRCLKVAWAAEKQRVNGRQPYQPLATWTPPETMFLFNEAGAQLRRMLSQQAA